MVSYTLAPFHDMVLRHRGKFKFTASYRSLTCIVLGCERNGICCQASDVSLDRKKPELPSQPVRSDLWIFNEICLVYRIAVHCLM